MKKKMFVCGLLLFFGLPVLAQENLSPSRAAWWLAQDDVKPIADLVNTAQPGKPPRFVDRVDKFQIQTDERALVLIGDFPEANIWRFDLTTFDGQFDMRKLYIEKSANCAYPDPKSMWTRKLTEFLGDSEKGITATGPWGTYNGKWIVPTARVALDGQHVYTNWFDDPSLADMKAGRVYSSFALDIATAGKHTIRIAFDDFAHGTRWRMPRWKGDEKPPITYSKNDLRPHHVGSVAIGIDERVRALEKIALKPELRGKHPRIGYAGTAPGVVAGNNLTIKDVETHITYVDPDKAKPWEYSIDAEGMASDNDMDAGRKGTGAALAYDQHVARLSPEAKKEWDRAFLERFQKFYTFFVFQRNYHPTGYAQNHSSATVGAILAAGLVWDGPEAEKWLRWGVMTCRKRIELYGRDGGLEWMNEARDYGLAYFKQPLQLIKEGTGVDITTDHPFFKNEWRFALHQGWMFPTGPDRRPPMITLGREIRGRDNPNVPVPDSATAANTPTNWHFNDVDQVFMRTDWTDKAYRARLWAGSVFGKEGSKTAKRYNWAHCPINQGSFILSKGRHEIILEAGWTREYRRTAATNNCILINDTDQWGGGQVWHPRLEQDQIAPMVFFADGTHLSAARTDLKNAYPPEAQVKAVSRCLIHLKPDLFLVFDRVETTGKGKAEWRYHAAYLEPMSPSSRYTAFAYEAGRPLGNPAKTYEEAFKKVPDVNCEVAFLTPGVTASIHMTDAYFRWSAFSQPQRHMRVVRESDGPMTLLTAFGPKIDVQAKDNVYTGRSGDVAWTVLVGGGKAGALESDAHLAIAAHNAKTGRTEIMRFGGKTIAFNGTQVEVPAPDVFAVVQGGKVAKTVATLP